MSNSFKLGNVYTVEKNEFKCYDCLSPIVGISVPYFILLFKNDFDPKKHLAGIECEGCNSVISLTCKNSLLKKISWDLMESNLCPKCGNPLVAKKGILKEDIGERYINSLSNIWANLKLGKIRQKLSGGMDIIGTLIFSFVIFLIGVELLDSGNFLFGLVGLIAFGAAILQLLNIAWYFTFLPTKFYILSAISDITFGITSLLLMKYDAPIIFPIGFILIPIGLWRLYRYRRYTSSIALLQNEMMELETGQ